MYLHQLFPHKETSQRRGSKKREKKLGKKKRNSVTFFIWRVRAEDVDSADDRRGGKKKRKEKN